MASDSKLSLSSSLPLTVSQAGGGSPATAALEEKQLRSRRPKSCGAINSGSVRSESSSVSDDKYSDSSNNNKSHDSRPVSYSGAPLAKTRTLVQPRPWRFWQRNRMGNSLDRGKVLEEDSTLEGDSRSESSAAEFTSDADSSSDSDSSSATITEDNYQKPTPHVEMRTSVAVPAEIAIDMPPTLNRGSLRKSDRPKVVTFSGGGSPRKSQSDLAPAKRVVVDIREKSLQVSFQKPEDASSPKESAAKSQGGKDQSENLERSVPVRKDSRRSKEMPASPTSPVEDVLFSMGYTVIDDKTKVQDDKGKMGSSDKGQTSYSDKAQSPYSDKGQASYSDKGQSPYSDKGQSPYSDKGQAPYSDKGQSPYSDKGQSPYSDKGQAPYSDKGQASYNDKGQAPYSDKEQPPYSDKGLASYSDKGQSPYSDKGQSSYSDKGQAPYSDKGQSPYSDKGQAPYSDKGLASYSDKGQSPYSDKGQSPYSDKGQAPYSDKGLASYSDKGQSPYSDKGQPPYSDKDALTDQRKTVGNLERTSNVKDKKVKHESKPVLKKSKDKKSKKAILELDKEKQHLRLFSWKTEHSAKHKTSKRGSPHVVEDNSQQTIRGTESDRGREATGQAAVGGDSGPAGGLLAAATDTGSQEQKAFDPVRASVTEKKLETKSDGGKSLQTPSSEGKSESTVQQLQHEQQQPVTQQQQTPTPSPQSSSLQQRQPQEQLQHPPQEQPPQLQHQSIELHPPSRQLPQPQLQSPPQVQRPQQSLPPPKPPHVDDLSSSDTQNSDWESPYSTMRTSQARGRQGHISESDGEITPVTTLRRAAPRRHTVGGADIREQMEIETERKREAFYELLAHRYPEYADKITAQYGPAERIPRPREPQRRRTTIVNYNPRVYGPRAADYEDPGTMSDMDLPSFQRGGYARASLPVARSASSSLERPLGERSLGLVFLLFRDETKKALLPNEITSLDTVRAMFVRAFPEKLNMEFLDSPKRKIYILEAATNIFFQLEDLRDIKDRTVLKIHECESAEPQRVKCPPEVRGRAMQPTAPPPRSSSRSGYSPDFAPVQPYQSREEIAKAQSLPVSVSHNYQDLLQKERVQWELEQEYAQKRSRSRSQTPEPAERPRSLSTGGARTRFSHSPDRLPTPDRTQYLNPIPENPRLLANGFREELVNGNNYEGLSGRHPQGYHSLGSPTGHHPPPPGGRVLSPPPVGGPLYDSVYASYAQPQAFITHSMRAGPSSGPQRATAPPLDGRSGNRPSHSYVSMPGGVAPVYDGGIPQRSQSYRVPSERDLLQRSQSNTTHYPENRGRMERMEAQIASLAAWVHNCQTPTENVRRGPGSSRSMSSTQSEGTDTIPGSTTSKLNGESSISSSVATNSLDKQGLSDIPSASYSLPQPVVTVDMREKIITVQNRLKELRKDFQGLRRMEQLNQEAMRDSFNDTFAKIKKVIMAVPGAENQVLCQTRLKATTLTQEFLEEKDRVEQDLSDLEASVEKLKQDVLARRCRVNANDVESMAVKLSNITKSLADLKARFPDIQKSLKNVISAEQDVVIKEERFMKEEPAKIEEALKRCKKLTGKLYTLKRLATEQNQCLPQVPSLPGESNEFGENEKMAVLENIHSMVPDHKIWVQSMEATDASRELKKKITTKHEVLKFTKTLQTASKSLKPLFNVQSTMHGNKTVDGEPSSRTECIVKEKMDTATSHFNEKGKQLALPVKPACTLSDNAQNKAEGEKSCDSKSEKALSTFSKFEPAKRTSASTMNTVTATSQTAVSSNTPEHSAEQSANQRSTARLAFFSSMQSLPTSLAAQTGDGSLSSPTTSSGKIPGVLQVTVSPTAVTLSQARSSGMFYQVSPTCLQSVLSSIPLPKSPAQATSPDAANMEGGGDGFKLRKVPPPPPPRKSSAKFPFGHVSNGVQPSDSSTTPDSKKVDVRKKDGSGPVLCKSSSFSSSLPPGPLSSTPKPVSPQKPPLSRFQKDIATGIYANMNRPDLQNQKVPADRILDSMTCHSQGATSTNSEDAVGRDDHNLSESESTGSSTSLDSQQGFSVKTSGAMSRRSKPEPPQRHSSLLTKLSSFSSTSQESGNMEKPKECKEGALYKQTNGIDGERNGHKT